MKDRKKSITLPLNSISLMYWLNLSVEKERKFENSIRKELTVFKTKHNDFLLIEGYDLYFSMIKQKPDMLVTFVIGDYPSELEARYAAVRELLSYQRSAWVTKIQQIKILHTTYKQSKNTLSYKLGIPLRKVDNFMLDEGIPIKIRAKAAECDMGRLANSISRSELNPRLKNIMYEFVTYPSEHIYCLTVHSWELARTMLLENQSELMKLPYQDIRFLIVRHAIEYVKRSKENFQSDIKNFSKKAPIPLFRAPSPTIRNQEETKKFVFH
ncbi:hypothetical protein ACERII_12665 [Evansella sp. AB-rgal1]|uniref:hypothetical protein n=1 Tax=Evansella sp. AB-rgal1 TaxID=3242696 RepID=UPI00359D6810